MSYREELESQVEARIEKDLKDFTVNLSLEHRAYVHKTGEFDRTGHWKCRDKGTMINWFDIIVWPGCLCINGDMGTFVFSRTNDMISFMQKSAMSYSYAAEKCVAGETREWSHELFLESIKERLSDDDLDEDVKERLVELLEQDNGREFDMMAMYESGVFDEMPRCEYFTFHFLWCLHAIKWFCDKVN